MRLNETHAFCWTELMVPNVSAAKTFYESLLGWSYTDVPMATGGTYTIVKLKEMEIAGIFPLCEDMKAKGARPHFSNYVKTEDVDQTVKKATTLGAQVLIEPFDIPGGVGRMAGVIDPTGAMLSLWQPGNHKGYGAFQSKAHGAPDWFELATTNVEVAGKFYCDLFDWTPEAWQMPTMTYTCFKQAGDFVAGMLQITKEWGDVPSHWMTYFHVDHCDQSAALAKDLGATLCVPPTDIPEVGRFSVITDPQGATFSIIQSVATTSGK